MQVDAHLPSPTYDNDGTLATFGDACRGALPIRLSPTVTLSPDHRLLASFGYAFGNGLDEIGLLAVSPWDASLEDKLKNINGSGRDFLRKAWYEYQKNISDTSGFAVNIGLIDSTDYLDTNLYANDEFTQFMSGGFVNSVVLGSPNNDVGVAFTGHVTNWSLNLIAMSVGGRDDDPNYKFWGSELTYTLEHDIGTGHYRILLSGTSKDFYNVQQSALKKLSTFGLSADQTICHLGLFSRLTWQKQQAAVKYKALYSFGGEYRGVQWSRPNDKIGLAYAYLKGGNQDLQASRVLELYYSIFINRFANISFDIQHHHDKHIQQKNPHAWVFSTRTTIVI